MPVPLDARSHAAAPLYGGRTQRQPIGPATLPRKAPRSHLLSFPFWHGLLNNPRLTRITREVNKCSIQQHSARHCGCRSDARSCSKPWTRGAISYALAQFLGDADVFRTCSCAAVSRVQRRAAWPASRLPRQRVDRPCCRKARARYRSPAPASRSAGGREARLLMRSRATPPSRASERRPSYDVIRLLTPAGSCWKTTAVTQSKTA